MNSYRKYLVPSIYVFAVFALVISVIMVLSGINKYINEETNYKYTLDNIFDKETIPVNGVKQNTNEIVRPYISDTVTIGKYFYDKDSEASKQQSSIIEYNGSYIQNTGTDYVNPDDFDIVSISDGEIVSIEDSEIYGKVITIKHNDNFISVYSNVSDVLVNVGYKVTKGEIIASTTKSKLDKEKSLLHFEVYYKNKAVHPETLYTLSIEDFK